MLNHIFILFFLFIIVFFPLYGQGNKANRFPIEYYQHNHVLFHSNPSLTGIGTNFESCVFMRRQPGRWSVFNSSMAYFYYRFNNGKAKHNSTSLGLHIINDSEGKFIKQNRLYTQYAWQTKISGHVHFSGGIEFGFINNSIEGTVHTGNSSSLVPDGSAGVTIFSEKDLLGISAQQLFNSEIQPFSQQAVFYLFIF